MLAVRACQSAAATRTAAPFADASYAAGLPAMSWVPAATRAPTATVSCHCYGGPDALSELLRVCATRGRLMRTKRADAGTTSPLILGRVFAMVVILARRGAFSQLSLWQDSSTSIAAVDGIDVGTAGGGAVFSPSGWVEFPGPPATAGGDWTTMPVAYVFRCSAPSTVRWKLRVVASDANSDSVFVRVETAGEWVAWHLANQNFQSRETMNFEWSTSSNEFEVGTGPHVLQISEREVRHARCLAV